MALAAAHTGKEMALAHALTAERLLGPDAKFLNDNVATRSLFVAELFHSLEIALKHLGIATGAFTAEEARGMRSGHGIKELAWAIAQFVHGKDFTPVSMALAYNTPAPTERIINLMMYGPQFDKTREHYARRMLAYGEFENGDLAMVSDLKAWVEALKQMADRLDKAVEIVRGWRRSGSTDANFLIIERPAA